MSSGNPKQPPDFQIVLIAAVKEFVSLAQKTVFEQRTRMLDDNGKKIVAALCKDIVIYCGNLQRRATKDEIKTLKKIEIWALSLKESLIENQIDIINVKKTVRLLKANTQEFVAAR
ncbi:hypothetical protein CMO93_02430 [Candidatus Woesearchaeota archaeon]|nr:hypothetical protein [Candidatus Woesearchaeota archaeon]|tara:strand:- start:2147 stop:2494 length:348 start_codon:yes stop_codon:yes gene_type:complete